MHSVLISPFLNSQVMIPLHLRSYIHSARSFYNPTPSSNAHAHAVHHSKTIPIVPNAFGMSSLCGIWCHYAAQLRLMSTIPCPSLDMCRVPLHCTDLSCLRNQLLLARCLFPHGVFRLISVSHPSPNRPDLARAFVPQDLLCESIACIRSSFRLIQ